MLRSSSDIALLALALTGSLWSLNSCKTSEVLSGDGIPTGGTGEGDTGSVGTGGAIIRDIPSTPSTAATGGSTGTGTRSTEVCTDGVGCVCPPLNVAVIGKPGKWGANPNGDSDTALQEWLNSSSAGTAKVDNFTDRTKLTPEFLALYNVIILASQGEDSNRGPFWSYDDSEVAAFRAWVENGGGVISLIGYSGDPGEITPVNQLIGFSGMTYGSEGVWTSCPGSVDWRVCQCAHSSPIVEWNRSDPVIANLSNDVTWVGLENGRPINAGDNGHVAATVPGPKNVLVGRTVGKGRVLAYGDEWITYTSQWNGEGNPSAQDPNCTGYLPQNTYQTAQFWYNMIKWSAPSATCFRIVDKDQPVVIW